MHDAFKLPPDEWERLRSLLDEALTLPPGERAAWVEGLDDARHAALKPRLRSLLAHAGDAVDGPPGTVARLLETLPKVETGEFAAPLQTTAPPAQRIGPYRLIRELGSGGMATVWLAERGDMLQRRQVALKLPHGAWKRAGLAERLAREREILATLEHPHIARLYDAGVAEDGQPWLALEWVDGERIDAYVRRKGLDVPARLRLFLQVVRAVAHAHAQLVVHRDLKPGNILVTEAGEVKLLDFGIAKLLEQGVAAESELTREAGRALTPEYAAPEQILGRPIGTAADVYALGVVLCELLAGQRPYRVARDSRAALEEAILHAEVPRPSTLSSPVDRRMLKGDLDTIVLKALKKEPRERYATADALAEDIERWLAHRPVLAQPDSAMYRFAKFVRRNRLALGAGAVAGLALTVGAGVAAWQAVQARAEQRRADEARAFIESIFVGADPSGESGRRLTGVELLRQARARLAGLSHTGPEVRADLLNTLATSMLNLEDADGARAALDDAAREAPALGAHHRQVLRSARLRAWLEVQQGRPAEARRMLDRVVQALHRGGAPEELRAALLTRAQAENDALDWPAAEASARQVLELADRAGDAARVDRIAAWLQLSVSHDRRNQSQPAFEAARRAFELAIAAFPGAGAHPIVNDARAVYAAALWDVDEQDQAVDLMRTSWRETIAVFGPDSRIAGQQARRMAVYLASTGYAKEAIAAADDAMRVLGPTVASDSLAYATLLDARTAALLAVHRPAEALEAATRAREIVVAHLGETHEQAHVMQSYRARALMLLGRLDEATQTLETLIERYRRTGHSTVAAPTFLLGVTRRLAGDPARALALQQTTLGAVRQGPTQRRWSSRVLIEIGLNQLELGELQSARASLAEGLAIVQEKFRVPVPLGATARVGLGRIELAEGRPAAALPHLEAADAFWREADPDGRNAGEAAHWLSQALAGVGRDAEAEAARQRAVRALAASPLAIDAALREAAPRGLPPQARGPNP